MAWAQELKNLVAEIKTGHRDREQFIKDLSKEVKDFLAKSEVDRKKDFEVFMSAIRNQVKEIKTETNKLLGNYRTERKEAAGYWASLKSKAPAPAPEAE